MATSKVLKPRRGSTAEHTTFKGQAYEITFDTDKKTIVAHDGLTMGGFPLAHETALTETDEALRALIEEKVSEVEGVSSSELKALESVLRGLISNNAQQQAARDDNQDNVISALDVTLRALIQQELAKKLDTSGGMMSGPISFVGGGAVQRTEQPFKGTLLAGAGDTRIWVFEEDSQNLPGHALIRGTNTDLLIKNNGTCTVNNATILTSKGGNVEELTIGSENVARSVQGWKADASGNVPMNTSWLASIGMPGYHAEGISVGASGTTYTAPKNGYFSVTLNSTGAGGYLALINTSTNLRSQFTISYGGHTLAMYMPAKQGDTVQIHYANAGVIDSRFVYANGEG